jgi:hypothetical protein
MAYSPIEQSAKELSTIAENAINGNFIKNAAERG